MTVTAIIELIVSAVVSTVITFALERAWKAAALRMAAWMSRRFPPRR